MGLFSKLMTEKITAAAVRSQQIVEPKKQVNARSIKEQIVAISEKVKEHFPDSKAELITSAEQLHTYIDHMIVCGIGAIDTETTGLDRQKDHIVGWSLYYPDGTEVYIPCKHIVPIFDTPYANQLTYEQCGAELQRLVSAKTKLVMANADFDLSMIWHDFKVDLVDIIFFDVFLAWRCLKENEKDNTLKGLYTKYVVRGTIDKMKFNDFFSPELYPYCDPQIAKLYAAADARYTFELFKWQMQYLTKNNPKCKKYKFDAISDLYFGIENPLIKVCQMMHRRGVYLEQSVADMLKTKYNNILKKEETKLQRELQDIINNPNYYTSVKAPFGSVNDFNPNSGPHVEWLVYDLLKLDAGTKKRTTKKEILGNFNVPIIKNILKYRSLVTLISTFVQKLPKVAAEAPDGKIHCEFKSIGADCVTGDTIIPTSDGYFTAKELCHDAEADPGKLIPTEPFSIISINNSYDYATDIIYYPDTPTIKLTTACGLTIEGTPNHPIICTSSIPKDVPNRALFNDIVNWVKLENVRVGQYLKIPCTYKGNKDARLQPTGLVPVETSKRAKSVTIPMYISAEFAEFLGIYHADGSAYYAPNSYRIKISNKNVDVQNRVIYLTSKLFGVHPTVDKHKKRPDAIDTSINCLALSCMDKLLCHGASKKRIPKAIWLSPTDVINSYIRGMTLDSAVVLRDNNTRFLLSVANDEDASLIQQHLISQGILCSKQKGHPLSGAVATRLSFNADNYILFRDIIGFVENSKIVHDVKPSKSIHGKRVGNYFYLKVKSIEHRRADVYDLSVPNTHSFVGNAIICHNTGRFSSRTPNMQNIPSKNGDIRRMFRASPGYVMMSSDYS